MISEKVERVARAICKAEGYDPDVLMTPYCVPQIGARGRIVAPPADHTLRAWELYIEHARSAIEALQGVD